VKVVIHVGLQKTATKFLQKVVFPSIENINFLNKNEAIRIDMNLSVNKINLLSSEEFAGCPWDKNVNDRFLIADRLKKLFPNAKIILVVREKEAWLKSIYKNYVRKGGTHNFDEFREKDFAEERLEFEKYEHYLKKLFSEVYVDDIKHLKEDHYDFVKDLCEFIGCAVPEYKNTIVNKAWNDRQIKLGLFLNRYWYNEEFNKKGFINIKPDILKQVIRPRSLVSILNGEKW